MEQSDHDLLIRIHTHVKYIKKNIQSHEDSIKWLRKQNLKRKDWQEDWDTKTKTLVGVATFIGGLIVFLGNLAWDYFKKRR